MIKELNNIIHELFVNKYNRISQNSNYFYRFRGVNSEETYNDDLATLNKKCDENKQVCLIFDNELPFKPDMNLINYIFVELNSMDISNMASQDILIFEDKSINIKFLKSLDYVIQIAIKKENFFNKNILNNFITKIIIWAYTYVSNIEFNSDTIPKCIYYGKIERHAVYFLMLLYEFGFDVLYINPLKEEYFQQIEQSNKSILIKNLKILDVKSFSERSQNGTPINSAQTVAKQMEEEVTKQLFEGTGMYKPWQFRDGYTKSILLDGILEDIIVYISEPAKLREGFEVNGNIVTVPCLFKKIDGVYDDITKYQQLVLKCQQAQNCVFYHNDILTKNDSFNKDIYELAFCELSNGTFDIEQVKKTKCYKYSNLSVQEQNLILKKFNEMILCKNAFVKKFNSKEILEIFSIILSLDDKVINLIDNFDFTSDIPKIIIFLDNENELSDKTIILLLYYHLLGMDIVIFDPSGKTNINNILAQNIFNEDRLDNMKYNINYDNIIKIKKGFFSRLFD